MSSNSKLPRLHTVLVILMIVMCLAVTGFLIWWVPQYQVDRLDKSSLTSYQRFELEDRARATLATIVGGAILLVGAYVAWRNLLSTENNLALIEQGQLTERFTRAIEHLGAATETGKPRLEIRLGGIYALEKIALDDAERYHDTVVDVFAAYVRENARWDSAASSRDNTASPPVDIQAIMKVLSRRTRWKGNGETVVIDLRGTDLRGLEMTGIHFEGADLTKAHLEGATLRDANFEDAECVETEFLASKINGARFEGANLTLARLSHLKFEKVNLRRAELLMSSLHGSDLRTAIGLTLEQVESAYKNEETLLPTHIQRRSP
jgi:hypothetical protein